MYRVNGILRRTTIGQFPRWSLAKARDKTLALLRDADEGIDHHLPKAPVITFKSLCDQYWALHLQPNVKSGRNVFANLNHTRVRHLMNRPADSITKREIVAVIDNIVADKTPHAAVNVLRALKMMYNWAVQRDMVRFDPCAGIKPPKKSTERDRILTDAEIVAVWRGTFELPYPYGEMFRSFLLTGQRRSEVATIRWCDVSGDIWTIPRERVKKDRPHVVPLSQPMINLLADTYFFGENAFVFTTTGGQRPSSNFCKMKAQLDKHSGVGDWTIHDLRRTVRSKLAELRVPREVARKVLNHEDGKVDRIYNRHEYLDEKREALEKWSDCLKNLIAKSQ